MGREAWAVRAEGLSKRFRIYHEKNLSLKQAVLRRGRGRFEEFWAVQEVDLDVMHGQSLAIIGRNGSGKSTLLKLVAGILQPDAGSVSVDGRLAALLELGAGFYPEYTGRENIYLNGALHGLSRRYINSVLDEIIEFSDIPRFIDNTVKTYSSGMFARLGFAIAVHMDPEILVIDEILSVGDEAFQRRCFERIGQLHRQGTTMVVVSHSLDVVKRVCDSCIWLDGGEVRAKGPVSEVIGKYLVDVSEHLGLVVHSDRPGVYVVIENRPGPVRVREVRVSGPNGPTEKVRSGDSVEVSICYSSEGPLTGASFQLNFVREDGVEAFGTKTADKTAARELPADGEITLTVPRLTLMAGEYRLGTSIVDHSSGREYAVLAVAFPLEVTGRPTDQWGVVELEHKWRIATAPAVIG